MNAQLISIASLMRFNEAVDCLNDILSSDAAEPAGLGAGEPVGPLRDEPARRLPSAGRSAARLAASAWRCCSIRPVRPCFS